MNLAIDRQEIVDGVLFGYGKVSMSQVLARLLRPASTGPQAVDLQEADAIGVEKPLAVMFLDWFGGRPAWVLPNPSGLNAHYQLPDLVREFRALRLHVEAQR